MERKKKFKVQSLKFKVRQVFLILTSVFCFLTSEVQAVVPTRMNFQGRLLDQNKNPKSGAFDMTFEIYTLASGGALVWSETQEDVPVSNGMFSVQLGAVSPLDGDDFTADSRWLQVQVGTEILSPRERLVTSPYAFYADKITAGGITNTEVNDSAGIAWSKISKTDSSIADFATKSAGALDSGTLLPARLNGDYLNDVKVSSAIFADSAGSVPDNSITSAKIENGTIATDDIGDNQVTSGKVDFNYATSSSKGGAATSIATGDYFNDVKVSSSIYADTANAVTFNVVNSLTAGSNIQISGGTGNVTVSADAQATGPDPVSSVVIYEEFIGGLLTTGNVGDKSWVFSSIGGAPTFAAQAGVANRPGIMRMSTTGTNGQGGSLGMSITTTLSVLPEANTTIKFAIRVTAAANQNMTIRIGIMDLPTNVQPANGIYFQYVAGAGAGNWIGVCRSGGLESTTGNLLAGDLNAWHRFQIRYNAANSVYFSVDGGAESQVTNNITANGGIPTFRVVTQEAAIKSIDLDYYSLTITGLTR